jgi:hypothetical protein
MSTSELGIPKKQKEILQTEYTLSSPEKIQLKADNETSIKRAILNIVTTKNLRAAHIFEFSKKSVQLNVFEPRADPLNKNEMKGTMVFAMKQVRSEPSSTIKRIAKEPHEYIKDTKPIVHYLEGIDKNSDIFIVLIFNNAVFVTGNTYDESVLIKSIIGFNPSTKSEYKMTFKIEPNRLERLKPKDLTKPKKIWM